MNIIKFAVVGCGHIGKRHAEMITRNSEAKLVALIDIKDKKSCSVIQKIEGRINSEFLNIRNLADIEKTN